MASASGLGRALLLVSHIVEQLGRNALELVQHKRLAGTVQRSGDVRCARSAQRETAAASTGLGPAEARSGSRARAPHALREVQASHYLPGAWVWGVVLGSGLAACAV